MGPEPEFSSPIVDGSVYKRYIYRHGKRTVQMLMKHVTMDRLAHLSTHSLKSVVLSKLLPSWFPGTVILVQDPGYLTRLLLQWDSQTHLQRCTRDIREEIGYSSHIQL